MAARSSLLQALAIGCLVSGASGAGEPHPAVAPVSAVQSQPEIHLKLDFDAGENPFTAAAGSRVELVADPDRTLSGRSLHLARASDKGHVGAAVPLRANGATDLRIAFVVRAEAMQTVAVNVFDERRQDNTTPASPARIVDGDWHPVVLAAEAFHYNSDPPDRRIGADTSFASLFLYGREDGPAAALWIDKLVVYRGHDGLPPDAPVAVRAERGRDGSVDLTWQEPSDNTFPVIYSIHRKSAAGAWEKLGESPAPRYRDGGAGPERLAYRITAADFENNVSPPSSESVAAAATAPVGSGEPAAGPSIAVTDRLNYAEHVRSIRARGAGTVRPDVFLFAGDSITAATLYTHVLVSWLGRGLAVRQGVGMVTTEYAAAHVGSYLADARPEFAVMMYGTNDQARGISVSASMRHLEAVVDACVAAGTIPIVVTIPPRGFDRRGQRDQEHFNRALADLARNKRVPVSHAFEEMMRHDLRAMLYDGVHLQPEAGNDAAGRALRQTMDQVYFALRDTSRTW